MNLGIYIRMTMLVVAAARLVQGTLIDISNEVSNIIRHHNRERSESQLRAGDMLEMRWDDRLSFLAGEWAEKCRYRRPREEQYNVGSNLYYELDFVHGPKSITRLINTAFRAWTQSKRSFVYGRSCGITCAYVQMITARSNLIGCALATCRNLDSGYKQESYASLFVCFYSPRENLLASLPYTVGNACSKCPRGTFCSNNLCACSGEQQENTSREKCEKTNIAILDSLSAVEKHHLTSVHNRIREANTCDNLVWDPYLEKWAEWIVRCTADYPGPAHAYTNFDRLDQGDQIYSHIYKWKTEGELVNIQLVHGCRTPYDRSRCNHFTNIRQPMLTSMACAAKDCKDGTRQLVCLYDNKVDRIYSNIIPRNVILY